MKNYMFTNSSLTFTNNSSSKSEPQKFYIFNICSVRAIIYTQMIGNFHSQEEQESTDQPARDSPHALGAVSSGHLRTAFAVEVDGGSDGNPNEGEQDPGSIPNVSN